MAAIRTSPKMAPLRSCGIDVLSPAQRPDGRQESNLDRQTGIDLAGYVRFAALLRRARLSDNILCNWTIRLYFVHSINCCASQGSVYPVLGGTPAFRGS